MRPVLDIEFGNMRVASSTGLSKLLDGLHVWVNDYYMHAFWSKNQNSLQPRFQIGRKRETE